jgi:hypothetical protein
MPDSAEVPTTAPLVPTQRAAAVLVAAMFVAVYALRWITEDVADATSLLYVLPVALAASVFGRRAGIAAALVAVALLTSWILLSGADVTLLGWMTRSTTMFVLGHLLGTTVDRLRAVEGVRHRLGLAVARHRDAVEINDSIVQALVAAKWSLERGDVEGGLDGVSDALATAQQLVQEMLTDDVQPAGDVLRSEPRSAWSTPTPTA